MAINATSFLKADDRQLMRTFALVLSGAAFIAVFGLLVWHFFLVLTGQGTIEFYDNFLQWREARRTGKRWKNPYDRGCVKNFKVSPFHHPFSMLQFSNCWYDVFSICASQPQIWKGAKCVPFL